jgi:RNase P subunit RPR2
VRNKGETNGTIRRAYEETVCPECGAPLYAGERCYWLQDTPFCSRGCCHHYRYGYGRAAERDQAT